MIWPIPGRFCGGPKHYVPVVFDLHDQPVLVVCGATMGSLVHMAVSVRGGAVSRMIIGQLAAFGRNLSAFLETLAARAAA